MTQQNAKIHPSHTSGSMVLSSEMFLIQQGENLLYDARLLHSQLKSKRQFADWIKDKIINSLFKEGVDYFSQKSEKLSVGRKSIEYHLTIDMAKHIAMLENNEVGYCIRQKFIAKEKELRSTPHLPAHPQLFKGLKPETINGRRLYPYRALLARMGYNSTAGSAGSRVHRYPGHFVKLGTIQYITQEFALHLHQQRQVFNNRTALRAMQPVLPFSFNQGGNL